MESKGKKLLGRVFKNRDRRQANDASDVVGNVKDSDSLNDFFNTGDRLPLHPPPPAPGSGPPSLPKLNISQATRHKHEQIPAPSQYQGTPIPRRKKASGKLTVRFLDAYPEIIGEGGDESEIPPLEIGHHKRNRSQSATTIPSRSLNDIQDFSDGKGDASLADRGRPQPNLRRSQTDFSTSSQSSSSPASRDHTFVSARGNASKNEVRRSFIEIHQAEMREAEGLAFIQALRKASPGSQERELEDSQEYTTSPRPPKSLSSSSSTQSHPLSPKPPEVQLAPPVRVARKAIQQEARAGRPSLEQSPPSIDSISNINLKDSGSRHYWSENGSPPSPTRKSPSPIQTRKAPTFSLHDIVNAASDEALDTFKSRTRHLFELFRLHSEASKPIASCTPEDFVRGSIWWFLKGRMGVETVIREKPFNTEAHMHHKIAKQQAFTDLSKAYWMSQEIIPELTAGGWSSTGTEVDDVRMSLLSQLRKLTMSMKRNEFMPPEEPFLPQTVDKTIWVEYPSMPQDLLALLSGAGGSSFSSHRSTSNMNILDALPIGDTTQYFNFGRFGVEVYLMERDGYSKPVNFPCFLSTIRPQKQPNLMFVIASQNGDVQLRIQGNKNLGPAWEDLTWRNDSYALEIKLPRGFMLVVQCTQQDYRMLLSMYDFGAKVQSTLFPRPDEEVLFRSTLRSFQYFDADPQSRVFPKDPVQMCEVGMFENVHKENSPTGPRRFHRGYRVAVVTGPRTRTLSGVNHVYSPAQPVQFGFLRGEKDDPALVIRFESSRSKGRMVFTFGDEKERFGFLSLLAGTSRHNDEQVYAEASLIRFSIGQKITDDQGIQGFSHLNCKRARVLNDENGGDQPSTVLADRLRVVVDVENGSLTDRINVAPGELRLRADPRVPAALMLYRQGQNDMSVALADSQASKELAKELTQGLADIEKLPTVRTFQFSNVKELHGFQAALTGFKVLFDSIAVAFAIARRRMVVPIHKKWEATETRVQVVQQDTQVQLLAFFEGFSHGHCMNFLLKGTDIYENFSRSGKAGLRIVDAKFPLPRMMENVGEEAAFVCIDSPDFAGEHDDISILFEKDKGL